MRGFELDQLRTFTVVADAGSLSAAAPALHLSPSTVSEQMRKLEARAGVPLFVRSKRGVEPTAAGARLRERAVPICALTQHETLSQIQRGVALGATAILNRPITQGSVYTTLMMALSLQRRLDELHAQNAALRHKLDSGPLVAQAIARLIVELNVSEDAAYERIRARSMATHRSIADVCVEILAHAADHRRSSS